MWRSFFRRSKVAVTSGGSDRKPVCPAAENSGRRCEPFRKAGCRVTFLATNRLGTELTRSAFEIALFGDGGGIERLVSLDFKAMPEGKTRVLQFDIGEIGCDKVSRVLINDIVACDGTGLDPKVCFGSLTTVSRLDGVEFGV